MSTCVGHLVPRVWRVVTNAVCFDPDRQWWGIDGLFFCRCVLFWSFRWVVGPLPWLIYVFWGLHVFKVAPCYVGVRLDFTIALLCVLLVIEVIYVFSITYDQFRRKVMGRYVAEMDTIPGLKQDSRLGFWKYVVSLCGKSSYFRLGEDEDCAWQNHLTLLRILKSLDAFVLCPSVFVWLFRRILRNFLVLSQLFGLGLSLPLRTFSLRGVFTDVEVKAAHHKLLLSGSVDLVPGFPQTLNQEILEYLLGGWNASVEQFEPVFPLEAEWFEECHRQGVAPLPYRSLRCFWWELFDNKLGIDFSRCSSDLRSHLTNMWNYNNNLQSSKDIDTYWNDARPFRCRV